MTACTTATRQFGRVITAMVTPFTPEGGVDLDGAARLAAWLTRPGHNDGLVVNGTTGESATTTDQEKSDLLRAVGAAVPPGVRVIAGVGTNDTAHSVALARAAAAAGAHGLLVVTPYYSKPSQDGIAAHFRAIADATPLPVMLYDIPGRTSVALEPGTLVRLAAHDRITAIKDAKSDLEASSWVMRESDLAYYSGEDAMNLPLATVGAVGAVSVIGHFAADRLRRMLDAHRDGDPATALAEHRALLPVARAVFRAQAAVTVKAALGSLGRPSGPVRPPLIELIPSERDGILAELAATGALTDGARA
ncbi:4-hydroxy-tetrahydrodipicolinate synthase [Actinomadura xylanilytica]|uniref:4-hydroxy-tetrahydrodipicolinate synthase n=1 Tax=Actinomadura xylanilytica TaxID=887459 RepID=UPI00255AC4B2|nr:4-hydroxy-tetrahydrodipicolinate synthase [Actinomadura xylanilytica]MDL4775427.1 4-hydroxy-tetrahydrodipicolinate synthase [Actinomadura xylanilytica]